MKIKNKVLLSVEDSDLVNGVFFNDEVIEVADNCFSEMKNLIKVIFPKVKKIGNYCFRYNDKLTTIELQALTTCGNYCFRSNASLTSITLQALTTCGNYCFSSNASLTSITLQALTTCGNDCFRSNASLTSITLQALTTCGNYCFSYNDKLTTIELQALTTCGNDCFRSNASLTSITLQALTTCGNYCFSSNASLTSVTIEKVNLLVKDIDGYCFVIEKIKTSKGIKIYSGYNFSIKDKLNSFAAEKDGFFAHGETIKKAIGDLQFKIVSEKLKNEPINEDTIFTIQYYRLLTGACEFGVKEWMNSHKINEGITAKELLPILEKTNAYGLSKFKQLITF